MTDDLKTKARAVEAAAGGHHTSDHFGGFYARKVGPAHDAYDEVPELNGITTLIEGLVDRIEDLERQNARQQAALTEIESVQTQSQRALASIKSIACKARAGGS